MTVENNLSFELTERVAFCSSSHSVVATKWLQGYFDICADISHHPASTSPWVSLKSTLYNMCVFNSTGKRLLLEQVIIVSECFKREESSGHPEKAKPLSASSLVMKLTKKNTFPNQCNAAGLRVTQNGDTADLCNLRAAVG